MSLYICASTPSLKNDGLRYETFKILSISEYDDLLQMSLRVPILDFGFVPVAINVVTQDQNMVQVLNQTFGTHLNGNLDLVEIIQREHWRVKLNKNIELINNLQNQIIIPDELNFNIKEVTSSTQEALFKDDIDLVFFQFLETEQNHILNEIKKKSQTWFEI